MIFSASRRVWAPAAIFFLITAIYTLIYYYRAPFHDHWDIVPFFAAWQDGTLKFSDLFALHGNHWHASGYLVMLGLSPITGMAHWVECLVSLIFAAIGFAGLTRIYQRSCAGLDTPRAFAWLVGIGAFFWFSLDQAANWLWGWQVAVFISTAGSIWAIELLSRGAPSVRATLLAILASGAAIYGFATSWTLIPIGFFLLIVTGALKSRSGLVCLALWTAFTALMLWHYSLALTEKDLAYIDTQSPSSGSLSSIFGLIVYALNYLGSPLVRFANDISIPMTLLGGGLALWALLQLRERAENILALAAPYLALMAYAAGAGLLTGMGRWETFGAEQAFVSRYITFGNFFWLGVFGLCLLALHTREESAKRARWIIGLLGFCLVLKVGNIPSVASKSARTSNLVAAAAQHITETFPNTDPAKYAVTHAATQDITARIKILQKHQVSFFAGTQSDARDTNDSAE